MIFLFLFFLLFVSAQQEEVVVIKPFWSCWFPTYQTRRVINIVFGYNNTGTETQSIGTGSSKNLLTPSSLDGLQPILFKPGLHELDFSLNDYGGILEQDFEPIVWTLNGMSVTIRLADIVDEKRCNRAYQGACPMWIGHFCEDSQFCNGLEICTTPDIGAFTTRTMGTCKNQSTGQVCQPGFACSEVSLGCVDATPPPPPPPSIIPSFHCWFYTYDETLKTMIFNVALNYNNTGPNILIRPITTNDASLTRNEITPSVYNVNQPTVFYSGFREDAFLLRDTVNLLATPTGQILWKLTDQQLVLTKDLITQENKCGGTTATPIISAPTPQPTELEQTEGQVHIKQCSAENPDCTAFDSFCNGPYECDIDVELCVQVNPLFSPCHSAESSISSGTPIRVTCVEHLSICVATVNCTVNSECNDGLLCNGKETCVNGTCVGQENVTIQELCGTTNAICIEGQGCVATNLTVSKEVVAGLSGGLVAGFLFISFILAWYFTDKAKIREERERGRRRRG